MIEALEVMIGALEGMVRWIRGPAASILLQKIFKEDLLVDGYGFEEL